MNVPFFFLTLAAAGLLGGALVIFVLKRGMEGSQKKFLLLTGGSAAGFTIGVILHNLLYAAAILTERVVVLHYLCELLHVAFFLVATILCPLGFIVGLLGSVVQFFKKR